DHEEHLPPAQLGAALRVDQRERWAIGDRVPAADYLRDFPAVQRDPEAALELIYGELLVREELGEVPAPEEYLRAYPEFAERLRIQIEVDRALGAIAEHGTDATAGGPAAGLVRALPCPAGYEIVAELGLGGREGGVARAAEPAAHPPRRPKDDRAGRPRRPRAARPLPPGGGGRRPPPSPAHRPDLRPRRPRRPAVYRDGVRRSGQPGRPPRRHPLAGPRRRLPGRDPRPRHPPAAPPGPRPPPPPAGQP